MNSKNHFIEIFIEHQLHHTISLPQKVSLLFIEGEVSRILKTIFRIPYNTNIS